MATKELPTARRESLLYANVFSRFSPIPDEPLVDQLLRHVMETSPDGMLPLRFAIVASSPTELCVETAYVSRSLSADGWCRHAPLIRRSACPGVVAHVVPTSVGAAIGGFAGDATPATRLLAQVADTIITHPNVVNASDILSITPNTLYVEGSILDSFFLGCVNLRPVRANVIGVVIEKQPQVHIDYVRYSVDAAHATCGIPVVGYAITREKVGARVRRCESGAYTGTIDNPEALLEAVERLVSAGATAIAITTEILDIPDLSAYVQGLAPNPHGGAEALLSHSVSRRFGLPAAHAPMWGERAPADEPPSSYDAREAAELVTNTALGCVLQGLHRAPQPVSGDVPPTGDITVRDVLALVTPFRAVGNIPALSCEKYGMPILGVAENATLHRVSAEQLRLAHYHEVRNYLEAAGVIAALKAGIAISSLGRPIGNVPVRL